MPLAIKNKLIFLERSSDGKIQSSQLGQFKTITAKQGDIYGVVTETPGQTPKDLKLIRKGGSLIVETEGTVVAEVQEFFNPSTAAFFSTSGTMTPEHSADFLAGNSSSISTDGSVVWPSSESAVLPSFATDTANGYGWGVAAVGAGLALAGGSSGSSGGGGGGSSGATSGSSPTPVTVTGRVTDGPIANSKIYLDKDVDGKVSAGDQLIATTDANGYFTVDASTLGSRFKLIAIQGTDTVAAELNSATFSAPEGVLYLNPISSIVQEIVKGQGVTQEAAQIQLATKLGINVSDLAGDIYAQNSVALNKAAVLLVAAAVVIDSDPNKDPNKTAFELLTEQLVATGNTSTGLAAIDTAIGSLVGTLTQTSLDSYNTFSNAIATSQTATDLQNTLDQYSYLDAGNIAPTVVNAIADQNASAASVFSFSVASNTFSDADVGDILSYTATQADNSALPAWLSFDAVTRTFNGTPSVTDVGLLSIKLTATDGSNAAVSDSFAITVVAAANHAPSGNVTITGTATQGQTLTAANTLADIDGLGAISYQWKADGNAISGATASTLVLAEAQVGKAITVVASYTDARSTMESVTSNGTNAVANINDAPTGSVTISGTATQGQTLTAANTLADIDGLGTISYQWNADGNAISGATSSTYVLTATEVGKVITVVAGYSDGHSTAENVISSATNAVAGLVNNVPTGSVTITGTATQGQTLTAANTLADADGLGVIHYQWKADGNAISGATASTLVLAEAQVGKVITVVASYTDGHNTAESVTSIPTSAVANVNDSPTGSVSITGTPTQGQTLTADTSALADIDVLGAFSYQWKADGNAISGATASTLVLAEAQVGKVITVVTSYTDGHNTAESVTSIPTSAVANVNDNPTGIVTISGNATQTQTLTAANTLADIDGLGTVTYQWKADGSVISGATASTYLLTANEVGKVITVVASYTDDHNTIENVSSIATSTVTASNNNAPTGSVTITGTATQGQTLTADTSALADIDVLGAFSYQWKADGSNISGATASTLVLAEAQVGKVITVVTSYTDGHNTAESVTSIPTSAVANVNDSPTGSITITGTATQGQTLTADTSALADIDVLGAFSYQWKADGSNISGATASTLVLAEAQVGKVITVVASYTDGHNTAESVTSISTSAVANVNDSPTGSLTITGTATQGQTLTADTSALADIDVLGAFSYQWKADGNAISGATASTLVLAEAQVGKVITVTASYTDGHNTAESVTSSATSAVANVNDTPTGSVSISGSANQGQTLTAANTLADIDGLGTITYQWKADGSAISGATGSTYVLTATELNKVITVTASYTDLHGTAESVTSSATSAVAAPTNTTPTTSGAVINTQTIEAGVKSDSSVQAAVHGIGSAQALMANITDPESGNGQTLVLTHAKENTLGSMASITAASTSASNGLSVAGLFGTLVVGADGSYEYTANDANNTVKTLDQTQTLNDLFTVTVSDGAGGTVNQLLTITIQGTNDAPTTSGAIANTNANEAGFNADGSAQAAVLATGAANSLMANISDADDSSWTLAQAKESTAASFSSITASTNSSNGLSVSGLYGTLVVGADGSYSYTADEANATVAALTEAQTLNDSFVVTVSDGAGGKVDQTLNITIDGTNDAPTISAPTNGGLATSGNSNIVTLLPGTVNSAVNLAVTDLDSANFDGGTLRFDDGVAAGSYASLITYFVMGNDSLNFDFASSGDITVYDGNAQARVGTMTSSQGRLDITFDSSATIQSALTAANMSTSFAWTPAIVQELMSNVQYNATSTTGSTGIDIRLTDGDGGESTLTATVAKPSVDISFDANFDGSFNYSDVVGGIAVTIKINGGSTLDLVDSNSNSIFAGNGSYALLDSNSDPIYSVFNDYFDLTNAGGTFTGITKATAGVANGVQQFEATFMPTSGVELTAPTIAIATPNAPMDVLSAWVSSSSAATTVAPYTVDTTIGLVFDVAGQANSTNYGELFWDQNGDGIHQVDETTVITSLSAGSTDLANGQINASSEKIKVHLNALPGTLAHTQLLNASLDLNGFSADDKLIFDWNSIKGGQEVAAASLVALHRTANAAAIKGAAGEWFAYTGNLSAGVGIGKWYSNYTGNGFAYPTRPASDKLRLINGNLELGNAIGNSWATLATNLTGLSHAQIDFLVPDWVGAVSGRKAPLYAVYGEGLTVAGYDINGDPVRYGSVVTDVGNDGVQTTSGSTETLAQWLTNNSASFAGDSVTLHLNSTRDPSLNLFSGDWSYGGVMLDMTGFNADDKLELDLNVMSGANDVAKNLLGHLSQAHTKTTIGTVHYTRFQGAAGIKVKKATGTTLHELKITQVFTSNGTIMALKNTMTGATYKGISTAQLLSNIDFYVS